MVSPQQLEQARTLTASLCRPMADSSFCLFISASDGKQRALVAHAVAGGFDDAWRLASTALLARMEQDGMAGRWLRVDWVEKTQAISTAELHARLTQTPRGQFRRGICFGSGFQHPLLEQELNANAILQDSLSQYAHAVLNQENLDVYATERFGRQIDRSEETILLLETRGVFLDDEEQHLLVPEGPGAGRRHVEHLTEATIDTLIEGASRYLTRQVDGDGRFIYGYYPCFDRQIPTYNMVRHAGTIYAMVEAWEKTREPALKAAIDRALKFLIRDRVAVMEDDEDGHEFAMLVDAGREIKLGGNAVLVLALTEYARVFDAPYVLPMASRLARGIERMQDAATGRFIHVLNFPDLSVKEESRIVYYDGEAAFALTRLYGATKDDRWLGMAERAASHFTAAEYWRFRDHWIAYFTNELTLYRKREEYFLLGIRNLQAYLDTDFGSRTMRPTFLELMTAAWAMAGRVEGGEAVDLPDGMDMRAFHHALDVCADRMLDSYFWPEVAMYFRNPDQILGSFFARGDSFRVRIDDVQHSISGLVAYRRISAKTASSRDTVPTPSR